MKQHWKKPDAILSLIILCLLAFGLVAVSSASAVLSFQRFGNTYHFLLRQTAWAAAGLAALYFFSRLDYHFFRRFAKLILLASAAAMAIVLIPGVGFAVGGSRSWFNTGFFFIQPSEFAKLAIIIYLAAWFDRKKDAETNFWFGIVPPLLAAGSLIGLTLLQRDLGAATVMVIITGIALFVAGAKGQYLFGLAAAAAVSLWLLLQALPQKAARFVTFLDPSLDPRGIGYHINQALLAIGSGGFWGYGFGASRQKHNFLPEPIGDSIFAVMAEELGVLRISIVVILFGLFAMRGVVVAKGAPDRFGRILAACATSWIGLQALVNIGALLNLMPLTGITLPFVSYGGSSLLAVCVAAGILLNVSRQRVG